MLLPPLANSLAPPGGHDPSIQLGILSPVLLVTLSSIPLLVPLAGVLAGIPTNSLGISIANLQAKSIAIER